MYVLLLVGVGVHLVVDVDIVEVVVVLRDIAIRHNDMGVPASPSGVFRLHFAPVPPTKRRDFPPAPLTLAGRCRYRIRARAPRDQDVRCAASASRSGRPSRETEAVALSGRSLS